MFYQLFYILKISIFLIKAVFVEENNLCLYFLLLTYLRISVILMFDLTNKIFIIIN